MAKKTEKLPVQTSSQKKGVMMSLTHNPRLVTILGGMVVGSVLWYFFQYKPEKTAKTALIAYINNADELLKKNMTDDALARYQNVLKTPSVRKYPEIYARIKNNEGTCYFKLSYVGDKEKNLSRAIRAYEEALKIRTVEKYPLYYEIVTSNMRKAKQKMKNEY